MGWTESVGSSHISPSCTQPQRNVSPLSLSLSTNTHTHTHTPTHTHCRLCQVEIAGRTTVYTKVVRELKQNLMGGDMPRPSREIGHTLLPLPLPSDAVLSEFHQLIHPHIAELVV